jgi:hypothetical protein
MPRSRSEPSARPEAGGPIIALAVDSMDWHARELIRAFAALGARARPVQLRPRAHSGCGSPASTIACLTP